MQLKKSIKQQGFSLVEMAIVLVILGFVIGALLLPLQAQRNQLFQSQTESTLETAKKALLGYAQAAGRLPCPASAGSKGLEDPIPVTGKCTVQVGFLPAVTLGVQPVDINGFAVDGWNNPIRYAVNQIDDVGAENLDFTTINGMANKGVANLQPNIRVCNTSTGVTVSKCSGGTESNYLIKNAVAVLYSLGSTGADASGGADETENLNAVGNKDVVFVSHEPRGANDPNGEFDHMVTWISPYVLYNAMIEAGQLH